MSEPNDRSAAAQVANGQLAHADQDNEADPWFAPAPKSATAEHPEDANGADGDIGDTAQWFLRTGRAGLLPDSMTESWEDIGHATQRPETASAPPWAGERAAGAEREEPPPWESGPWPGPGEERPAPRPAAAAARSGARPSADDGNWQATAALATGILPLVVPGIAFGVLGLRRAQAAGTGRTWSLLGIACSVIWAVILVLWLASGGSGQSNACGSYQAAVTAPVSQVLHDLSAAAPQSTLATDLRQAISAANSAAAAVQQVQGRNAMLTLVQQLQLVLGESGRTPDATMQQQVASASAAMARSCKA